MMPDGKLLETETEPAKGLKYASAAQWTATFFERGRTVEALRWGRSHMLVHRSHLHRYLFVTSCTVGALLLLLGVIWGWLHPAGGVGSAKIVADRETGTVYANVGGVLHPTNLMSAWLIAGNHDKPRYVSAAEIARSPQGPWVGINGAEPAVRTVATPQVSRWSICDTITRPGLRPTVTVIDGDIQPGPDLGDGDALLVTQGGHDWLVSDAHRTQVDRHDKTLAVPESAAAVPMSRALFDALPERKTPPTGRRLVDAEPTPVKCVTWRWDATERRATLTVRLYRGLPLTMAQRDHLIRTVGDTDPTGVRADQLAFTPGAATFVATTAIPDDPHQRGTMWVLASNGTRFGVPFADDSYKALGVARERARPVPAAFVQPWPQGPELAKAAAMVRHSPGDTDVLLPNQNTLP